MSLHLCYSNLLQFGGGGFTKIIGKIKAMFKNFLWGGTNNTFKAMVRWSYCCAKKAIGGLGLTNLEEAIEAFICKEVMTTWNQGNLTLSNSSSIN